MRIYKTMRTLEGRWLSKDKTAYLFAGLEDEWSILKVTPHNEKPIDYGFKVVERNEQLYLQTLKKGSAEIEEYEITMASPAIIRLRNDESLLQLSKQ